MELSYDFIEKIEQRLHQPLPGKAAQNKMAHKIRMKVGEPSSDAKIACVLSLLYPKNNDWYIILMKRVSKFKEDKHRGQVSFPGGKLEPTDESLAAGALREAQEEVNVDPAQVKLLGQLTYLYIPVSNFLVYPFVGYTKQRPNFIPDPNEVASIIEFPLNHLFDSNNIKEIDKKISPNLILKGVPYFDIKGEVVWGATAMILSELVEILKPIQNEILVQ